MQKNYNETGNQQIVPGSHFNINVTNLTNSLIVNQSTNNPKNPLDIPKKFASNPQHKKSKSQGTVKNMQNNSLTSNLLKKNPYALPSYKTSQEFFDAKKKT